MMGDIRPLLCRSNASFSIASLGVIHICSLSAGGACYITLHNTAYMYIFINQLILTNTLAQLAFKSWHRAEP